MRISNCSTLMAVVVALATSTFGAETVNYHLAKTYRFGSPSGGREYFDYMTLDPTSGRLYLSHGTEVLVVNADTGKEEGKISGLKVSHGVAVVPAVWVAASSVTVNKAR